MTDDGYYSDKSRQAGVILCVCSLIAAACAGAAVLGAWMGGAL